MPRSIIAFSLAATLAAPLAAQSDAWVHLSVRDSRNERAEVRINLPAPVVLRAAPLLPESDHDGYRLVVGDDSITAQDLSSILVALREAPVDGAARRDTGDMIVLASRSGDMVKLVIEEKFGGDVVAATLPLGVADALASGGRRLDLARAVRLLIAAGGGELALIAADEARIRIWVDKTPNQTVEW